MVYSIIKDPIFPAHHENLRYYRIPILLANTIPTYPLHMLLISIRIAVMNCLQRAPRCDYAYTSRGGKLEEGKPAVLIISFCLKYFCLFCSFVISDINCVQDMPMLHLNRFFTSLSSCVFEEIYIIIVNILCFT